MSHKQAKKIRKAINYRDGDTSTKLVRHGANYLGFGRGGWTEVITSPLRKMYQRLKKQRSVSSVG